MARRGVCVSWQWADQASWCQEVQRGPPAYWLTLKSALIHFREAMDDSVYIKADLSDLIETFPLQERRIKISALSFSLS